MTSSHPTPAPCQWFSWLAAGLDRRSAPRLALLFLGEAAIGDEERTEPPLGGVDGRDGASLDQAGEIRPNEVERGRGRAPGGG